MNFSFIHIIFAQRRFTIIKYPTLQTCILIKGCCNRRSLSTLKNQKHFVGLQGVLHENICSLFYIHGNRRILQVESAPLIYVGLC